jgi:hypothetical protein
MRGGIIWQKRKDILTFASQYQDKSLLNVLTNCRQAGGNFPVLFFFKPPKKHTTLLQLYILKIVLDFLFFETSLAKVFYGFNHSVLLQWQTRISRFCFSFWSFDILVRNHLTF